MSDIDWKAEIERLERGNRIAADKLQKRNQEIERLTAENERIEKEAACAAHNADKYHDIIREQRDEITILEAKVSQLEAVVEALNAYNFTTGEGAVELMELRATLQESEPRQRKKKPKAKVPRKRRASDE